MEKSNSQAKTATPKGISKKVRFEILTRDNYTCQYCGQSAPNVALQIDHIVPIASGGDNSKLNLITACKDCKIGKRSVQLPTDTVLSKQAPQIELSEKVKQQLDGLISKREELAKIDELGVAHSLDYLTDKTGFLFDDDTESLKNLKSWIKKYGIKEVITAIDLSASQYMKSPTSDCATHTFAMIPKICRTRQITKETGVDISHLLYIRGIIKNRFSYINPRTAMELLMQAETQNISEPTLRKIATDRKINTWTKWHDEMEKLIENGVTSHA